MQDPKETPLPHVDDSVEEMVTFPLSVRTLRGETMLIQVSPLDTAQDIRQFLFESAEACDLTSYTLHFNGKPINDFLEFGKIENLVPNSTLHMVPAPYTRRSGLLHIRRLREILSFHLFTLTNSPSPSVFANYFPEEEDESTIKAAAVVPQSNKSKKKKKKGGAAAPPSTNPVSSEASTPALSTSFVLKDDKSEISDIEKSSLSEYYPKITDTPPTCVKDIEFSGWNPPPGNRSLLGDLYYLEITTLEGRSIQVTSWTGGFYVNNSDSITFDPSPAAKPFHSHYLSGLLGQISAQFKRNFQKVLKSSQFGKHPFELVPVPMPLIPWVAPADDPHPYDRNRAEYSILYTEIDFTGTLRDWNEEYQSCKALPKATVQERLIRDRNIIRIHNEFVETAIRGAMMIVTGAILPVNPAQEQYKHIFVYNNIFYSYAVDTRDPAVQRAIKAEKEASEKNNDSAGDLLGVSEKQFGELITYVSINNDLRAIREFNDEDVKDLSTVLTCVVDYRGFRLVAQSLIPGIFQKNEAPIIYGSVDKGRTIVNSDKAFYDSLVEAGKQLRMKPHKVEDSHGNVHEFVTSIHTKGVLGTDGRRYVIDAGRTTPIDVNYAHAYRSPEEDDNDYPYMPNEPTFRPEFVATFCETLEEGTVLANKDKKEEGEAKPALEVKEMPPLVDTPTSVVPIANGHATENGTEEEDKEKLDKGKEKSLTSDPENPEDKETDANKPATRKPIISFIANILEKSKNFKVVDPEASLLEKEAALLDNMGAFLKEILIPRLADDLLSFIATPCDGQTLTAILHRSGINMRYLGLLATLCEPRPSLVSLMEQEMITRATKHEFNRLLREKVIDMHSLAHATSHFLNCFLGENKQPATGVNPNAFIDTEVVSLPVSEKTELPNGNGPVGGKGKKGKGKGKGKAPQQSQPQPTPKPVDTTAPSVKLPTPEGEIFTLTTESLWKKIAALVQERFDYELPLTGKFIPPAVDLEEELDPENNNSRLRLRNISTLRSFCLKVGLQLALRDYDLSKPHPFTRRDVLDIVPLAKHLKPKSLDGQHLLNAGKVFLTQGRLDFAFELFNEALAIFHQVYGPVHEDTAMCYGNLAMVHYHANDAAQALSHQRKMVIINERVLGLDHHETARSYGNLALFARGQKKDGYAEAALKCLKRAYYLSRLTCPGPNHSESSSNLLHIAMVYQDLGRRELALKFYQKALDINTYFFGKHENLQAANICHQIAMIYSEMDMFREALQFEKRNYEMLSSLLGEKDFRTNESNIWLKQFTIKGVKSQIEAKKAQRDITSKLSKEKLAQIAQVSQQGKKAASGTESVAVPKTTKATGTTQKTTRGSAAPVFH